MAGIPSAAATPLAAAFAPVLCPVVVLVAGGVAMWLTVVVYNITQLSFRQRVCPPPLLGRMNASVRFVVWGVQPIGAVVGGFLGQAIGILPTLWIAVAGTAVATLPVALSPLTRMGQLPSAPEIEDGHG